MIWWYIFKRRWSPTFWFVDVFIINRNLVILSIFPVSYSLYFIHWKSQWNWLPVDSHIFNVINQIDFAVSLRSVRRAMLFCLLMIYVLMMVSYSVYFAVTLDVHSEWTAQLCRSKKIAIGHELESLELKDWFKNCQMMATDGLTKRLIPRTILTHTFISFSVVNRQQWTAPVNGDAFDYPPRDCTNYFETVQCRHQYEHHHSFVFLVPTHCRHQFITNIVQWRPSFDTDQLATDWSSERVSIQSVSASVIPTEIAHLYGFQIAEKYHNSIIGKCGGMAHSVILIVSPSFMMSTTNWLVHSNTADHPPSPMPFYRATSRAQRVRFHGLIEPIRIQKEN